MSKELVITLVLVVAAVSAYFYFKNQPIFSNSLGLTSPGPSPTPTSVQPLSVIITASNYKYEPNLMRLKKDVPVSIVFKNSLGMHDFVLEEFDIKTNVTQKDEELTINFTPDKIGEFEYYCSVANHKSLGMVGTLIVED